MSISGGISQNGHPSIFKVLRPAIQHSQLYSLFLIIFNFFSHFIDFSLLLTTPKKLISLVLRTCYRGKFVSDNENSLLVFGFGTKACHTGGRIKLYNIYNIYKVWYQKSKVARNLCYLSMFFPR